MGAVSGCPPGKRKRRPWQGGAALENFNLATSSKIRRRYPAPRTARLTGKASRIAFRLLSPRRL
jgi:hypothetical protein